VKDPILDRIGIAAGMAVGYDEREDEVNSSGAPPAPPAAPACGFSLIELFVVGLGHGAGFGAAIAAIAASVFVALSVLAR